MPGSTLYGIEGVGAVGAVTLVVNVTAEEAADSFSAETEVAPIVWTRNLCVPFDPREVTDIDPDVAVVLMSDPY